VKHNDKTWFLIKDFEGFVNHARGLVFKVFGESIGQQEIDEDMSIIYESLSKLDLEEMNRTLPLEQCLLITKQHIKIKTNKKTKKIEYYINDKILFSLLESFNTRMVSNILSKLSNDGLLESAFDEEKNDFVFWIKEDKN
jgi:hypothetical protein